MFANTSRAFNVEWQAPNSVNIVTGAAYAANDTELKTEAEGTEHQGVYSSHQVLLNGQYTGFEPTNIDGNNDLSVETVLDAVFGLHGATNIDGVFVIDTTGNSSSSELTDDVG